MRKKQQPNTLFTGDNLYIMHGMDSASVDLIYLDPPFNSKRLYKAPVGSKAAGTSFKDMWSWDDVDLGYLERIIENYPYLVQFIQSVDHIHSKAMTAYLTYMTQRIIEMHRVLKPTGSFYLHCDPTASHYLKIVLDRVFGSKQYRNEVVWSYSGGGVPTKDFARKHDVILRYSKSDAYVFNKQYRPYSPTASGRHSDGTLFNLERGASMTAVWNDLSPVNTQSRERTGYPTQKPLALLHRIIQASSNEGDLVLDPFCGCATTCVAAQQLNRKWVGIDIAQKSAELVVDRLTEDDRIFTDFIHREDIPKRSDKPTTPRTKEVKEHLYKDQTGKCNACSVEMEIRHLEIDHIIPQAKGGGDYYDNYQLLCGNCNRIKGKQPMEYLLAKIKRRNEMMKFKVSFTK